ncbi:hypothetical protein [Actinacidiphila epipremni]|uniref:Uncharacterized protein n=1 Tax=Actinacidiphila epipremni TaxID=2053013 RepID=A0ABX0ZES7_9ACTN|nr:hypothetical protein [Actinacidiphila epipremni]NJP42303.1 hypothetical protein [Actinacidiphila epipremni]
MKLFSRRRPSPSDLAPVPVPPPAAPKAALDPAPVLSRAEFTPPPEPATARPAPQFQPGRYVVTYDRLGPHRLLSLAPLTVVADSAADLAEQIRTDLTPFVGATERIEVTVDMLVSGGKITARGVSGTFTFTRGGAR